MNNIRIYGNRPFNVAVIHGGPGAPGEMAPVARELSSLTGVLEPLQSKNTLEGQIDELLSQLMAHAAPPVTLIGSSWGAALALFAAARDRYQVRKLILIGSPAFDAAGSAVIEPRRMARLDDDARRRYESIQRHIDRAMPEQRDRLMREWGRLVDDTDMYDPLTRDLEVIEVRHDIYSGVWSDFVALRDRPGCLTGEFSKIDRPAVVIHGEYDPHPIENIRPFLENCLPDITFHILPECGHYPWIERRARDLFYDIMKHELRP